MPKTLKLDVPIPTHPFSMKSCNCKFGNFRENFNFLKKSHVCEIKNSRLQHELPTSVNGIVIPPFREGFIFREIHEAFVYFYFQREIMIK